MQRILDDPARGCAILFAPAFWPADSADALLQYFLSRAPFAAEAPVVFGKAHPVSRASCAFGDPGVSYRYSGLLRPAHPWPDWLSPAREAVERAAGERYNFVLCNHYPDGGAGLGWHADDEKDLVRGAPIASLSLGAARDFRVRRRDTREVVLSLALPHGSLLIMAGLTQLYYHHQVPKRARCHAPRVNLTFRRMRHLPTP